MPVGLLFPPGPNIVGAPLKTHCLAPCSRSKGLEGTILPSRLLNRQEGWLAHCLDSQIRATELLASLGGRHLAGSGGGLGGYPMFLAYYPSRCVLFIKQLSSGSGGDLGKWEYCPRPTLLHQPTQSSLPVSVTSARLVLSCQDSCALLHHKNCICPQISVWA